MTFVRKVKVGKYTYLREVKSEWVNGKTVQRYVRNLGKVADGKTILSGSLDRAVVDKVTVYGPLLVLHDIAEQLELRRYLRDYADEILALVYGHCIQPRSLRKLAQWFSRTELSQLLNLERVTEDSLYRALESVSELNHESIQHELFQKAKQLTPKAAQSVVYDVTNTYLYGIKCPLARPGYSKDKKRRTQQIQIALAVTHPGGLPVFCKTFSGNVHDARTLPVLFESVTAEGLPKPQFVFDRGCVSKTALKEAKKAKFQVVCGVPLQPDVKRKVMHFRTQLLSAGVKEATKAAKSMFYVKRIPAQWSGQQGYFYICLNLKNRTVHKEKRDSQLLEARRALKKGEELPPEVQQFFTPTGRVRDEVCREAERWDGYSVLFSARKLPEQEVVTAYYEKDLIEKAFQSMKSILGLRPLRHWLTQRVIAHIFICYLAYLLFAVLNWKLQPLRITATEALEKLAEVYRVHLTDPQNKNKFVKTVTLTKEQEKILRKVNPKLLRRT